MSALREDFLGETDTVISPSTKGRRLVIPQRCGTGHPTRVLRASGWQLWRVGRPAGTFLLLAEATALIATTVLVSREPATGELLVRFVLLAVLSIGYSEAATHSTRMQRYLGSDRAFSNPLSVWSYAAVLTVPAGWAAAFIALQYAHALWQRRRDATGRPHRVVFTAAATMLAQLAAAGVVVAGDRVGGVVAQVAVLVGAVVFLTVNVAIVCTGMWLATRPPRFRGLLPDKDILTYELGTLVLGIAAAQLLVHSPILVPALLVVVVLLHRSSVVKSLRKTARTDSKTGLLNAAAWTENARGILSRASRTGAGAAVLIIDLDHFKAINDSRGHLAGDRVLAAVAAGLRRELRDHDGLGRFGGEEFVAIIDGAGPDEAFRIGDRLRAAIGALHVEDGLRVTASIGIASSSAQPAAGTLESLLESADRALYAAKSDGRDRVRILAPTA